MYRGKTVGVVVPAYNESLLIGRVIATIPPYVDKIYVIDDCSTDPTSKVVQSYDDSRVTLTRHKKNKGVGAAIITGYSQALNDEVDLIAVMAGDNQMDPLELTKLLDPLIEGKADYCKGDRLSRPELTRGMSRWRKTGNLLLTKLTRISSGYWNIQDPQNGYTVISRHALLQLELDKVYPRYGYCNDILVKLNVLGLRVMDIKIPARYGEEKSKISYGRYIRKVSLLLFNNFIWRISKTYIQPRLKLLGVSYIIGLTSLMAGLFILLLGLLMHSIFAIGCYITILGTFIFSSSIIFDALSNSNAGEADIK